MNHQRLLPGYDNLTYPAHPSGHPQDQAHGSEHFDQEIPPQSFDSMGQAPHGFYQYGQPTHSVVSQLYGYGYPPGTPRNSTL
ncbi:uncharacterized protein JCM6883_004595 [Sporobolomyces salmoneus]|uniref:uncharacterized protein n=1 Tax=Sporobolomyces salmoneus TaxID=183962 RepID=UPI0031741475